MIVNGESAKYVTAHKELPYKEIQPPSHEIFKPLAGSEFNVEKTVLLCQTQEISAENAFIIVKVGSEEERNIRFVASSINILRHFLNSIKVSTNIRTMNPILLSKVIKVLSHLIFFVHKVDAKIREQADPITFDGKSV